MCVNHRGRLGTLGTPPKAMPKADYQPLPYSGSQKFSYATKAQQDMLVTENTLILQEKG